MLTKQSNEIRKNNKLILLLKNNFFISQSFGSQKMAQLIVCSVLIAQLS